MMQKGGAAIWVSLSVLVLGAIGVWAYMSAMPSADDAMMKDDAMMEDDSMMIDDSSGAMMKDDDAMMMDDSSSDSMMKDDDAMMKDEGDMMMEDDSMMMKDDTSAMINYHGTVITDVGAPLLEFNTTDYNSAIAAGKLVVLYFYADWCPICKEEFPAMERAFDSLTGDSVVGFRIHYKDSVTTNADESLARQFSVTSQHTKVFVKGGERVLKSPESWTQERYVAEISKY